MRLGVGASGSWIAAMGATSERRPRLGASATASATAMASSTAALAGRPRFFGVSAGTSTTSAFAARPRFAGAFAIGVVSGGACLFGRPRPRKTSVGALGGIAR
jgi:hypothetical protein